MLSLRLIVLFLTNLLFSNAQYLNCYQSEKVLISYNLKIIIVVKFKIFKDIEYYGNDIDLKTDCPSQLNCCILCTFQSACNSYTYIPGIYFVLIFIDFSSKLKIISL
jgi:hypothetical protein